MANDRGLFAPLIVVLAGPNGAGKTTTSARLLRGALAVFEYVNADAIAQGLSAFRPESVALAAGRIMLARLDDLVSARADFAFETTLAGRDFARRLQWYRAAGYRAHLTFVSLPSPELAVARVAERVRRGGHAIPESTIRRRYAAGLRNFFTLYQDTVDAWQLYENADPGDCRLVAERYAGGSAIVIDPVAWDNLAGRQE